MLPQATPTPNILTRLPLRQQLMSKRDLAAKYGTSKNVTQLVNAAIRAELPGGAAALDALHQLRTRADHSRGHDDCLAAARAIVDAMADEIRKRYGLTPSDSAPADDAS